MLERHQRFHVNSKRFFETDRHLGGQGDPFVEHVRNRRATDCERLRRLGDSQAERREDLPANDPAGMGRILHHGAFSLVVIHEIEIKDFLAVHSKNNPPVAANRHRPEAGEIAFEAMKPKPWQRTDPGHMRDGFDNGENIDDSYDEVLRQPHPIAGLIEPTQALVAKGSDAHRYGM
jgi:hypothetical protein